MKDLLLIIPEVQDPTVRENFDRIQRASDDDLFGKFRGKHIELSLDKNITYLYPHNLGFRPRDLIQTFLDKPTGASLTWNYGSFDRTNISLTVAGLASGESVDVRAFVGVYVEQ